MYIKYTLYLLLLSVYSELCFSQSNINLETEIEITNTTKKRSADGKITLKILNGVAPYKIYLSRTPAPTKEEDIIETKEIDYRDESVLFENLIRGVYYIISVDIDEIYSVDKITIEQQSKQ